MPGTSILPLGLFFFLFPKPLSFFPLPCASSGFVSIDLRAILFYFPGIFLYFYGISFELGPFFIMLYAFYGIRFVIAYDQWGLRSWLHVAFIFSTTWPIICPAVGSASLFHFDLFLSFFWLVGLAGSGGLVPHAMSLGLGGNRGLVGWDA